MILRILSFVFNKIVMVLAYIVLIISILFLLLGTWLMDSVLKLLGVEKQYLLSTDIKNWNDVVSVYLKTYKIKHNNTTGEKENV